MATGNAARDENRTATLVAISSSDGETVVPLYVDETTNRLLVNTVGGGGTSETDDAGFTAGTTTGTPAMGAFTADTVDAGDVGVLAMDASRRLLVSIEADNAGIGGGTQYDEDTVHTTGDTGTMSLAVRNDTLAALAGTDGDYTPLQVNSDGALYTSIDGTVTISGDVYPKVYNGAAWENLPGTEAAGLTVNLGGNNDVTIDASSIVKAEDSAHSTGDDGVMALAVRNDTLATLAGADGDYAPLQVDDNGALYSAMVVGGFEVGSDGLNADNVAPGTGLVAGAYLRVYDGANWDRARGDATDGLLVNLGSNNDISGTVTANLSATDNAVLDDISTDTGNVVTSVQIMDDWDNAASDGASVSGDVAHDTADAGEPVKIGGKAIDMLANPTEVAADDRTDGYFNRAGIQFVAPGHPNILSQSLQVTDVDGAQTDTAIVSVAAGEAIVVTGVQVYADNANTSDVQCRIGFGTANTPAVDAADVIFSHNGIAAGGGAVVGGNGGILATGASGEDLRVTCEDPSGGALDILVQYYTISI